MSGKRAADKDEVRQFIFAEIEANRRNLAKSLQTAFSVSRPTAHNYLRSLIDDGLIIRLAPGKYDLVHRHERISLPVAGLEEHRIWAEEMKSKFDGLSENVVDIWHYGCTEMINNVVDHSDSEVISIDIDRTPLRTEVRITDIGIGIFRKIAEALNLEDDRHSALELAKGKVTTDPENHTGEGIFFSSRVFDSYVIVSGDIMFTHDYDEDYDWIVGGEQRQDNVVGTMVFMALSNNSEKTLQDIFGQFATDKIDYRFDRTIVPVRLLTYGDDRLVSRSQAKRLLSRIDRFKHVILNFSGVEIVGQAFADEIFRVFAQQHPEVDLVGIHTNEQVSRMINRATENRG